MATNSELQQMDGVMMIVLISDVVRARALGVQRCEPAVAGNAVDDNRAAFCRSTADDNIELIICKVVGDRASR